MAEQEELDWHVLLQTVQTTYCTQPEPHELELYNDKNNQGGINLPDLYNYLFLASMLHLKSTPS